MTDDIGFVHAPGHVHEVRIEVLVQREGTAKVPAMHDGVTHTKAQEDFGGHDPDPMFDHAVSSAGHDEVCFLGSQRLTRRHRQVRAEVIHVDAGDDLPQGRPVNGEHSICKAQRFV